MSLGLTLKYLYPEAEFGDFALVDDGSGPELRQFDEAKLGKAPTLSFLRSKEAEAVAFFQTKQDRKDQEQTEIARLQSVDVKDWTDADVKSALQIWIARQ